MGDRFPVKVGAVSVEPPAEGRITVKVGRVGDARKTDPQPFIHRIGVPEPPFAAEVGEPRINPHSGAGCYDKGLGVSYRHRSRLEFLLQAHLLAPWENESLGPYTLARSVLVLVRPFFMSGMGMFMRAVTAGRMFMNMALLACAVVMGMIMLMIVLMLMLMRVRMAVCVVVVGMGVLMLMPVPVVMFVTMFVFTLHEVLLLQYAYSI